MRRRRRRRRRLFRALLCVVRVLGPPSTTKDDTMPCGGCTNLPWSLFFIETSLIFDLSVHIYQISIF